MNFLKSALIIYLKKPLIIIYVAIATLVLTLVGFLNPLSSLVKLYSTFITDSITNTVIIISKEIYKIGVIPYIALGVLVLSLMLAILSGVIYSGYFYIIFKSVKKIKPLKNDIITGIKKYFVKVSYVFFEFYFMIFGFLALIPLILVPHIVILNKAIENNSVTFFNNTLIALVTGGVILLVILLILVEFTFRMPSIFFFNKKPIEKSKLTLSMAYWTIFGRVALFLIVLIMIGYLILSINIPIIVAILNWIFGTIFFSLFSIYMFYDFMRVLNKLKKK